MEHKKENEKKNKQKKKSNEILEITNIWKAILEIAFSNC